MFERSSLNLSSLPQRALTVNTINIPGKTTTNKSPIFNGQSQDGGKCCKQFLI